MATETMKIFLIPALLLAAPAFAQVTLQTPSGGWRNASGEKEQYTQTVNYPASSVNMQERQSISAQIRGRVKGAKADKPGTLIVNGVPMPIQINLDGSFERPYAFGRKSNNVEVRSPDGKQRTRAQFYEAYGSKTQARLRVVLSWDSPGTDLDLHVIAPDGGHAWYGEPVMNGGGGALDVDVTTGYGPEIFASSAPVKGAYHVYVNYYGSGERTGALTIAQVTVITNENSPSERQQTFRVPMRAAGELTLVKSFVYP